MSPVDLYKFATETLRAHRIRTRLTVLAVAIGVASVLLLTALGESARTYVINQFSSLGSNLLVVLPGKVETTGGAPLAPGGTNDITYGDVQALDRRIPRILDTAPISVGQTMANYRELSRSITMIGTTRNFLRLRHLELAAGQSLPDIDPRKTQQVCLIGSTVRKELFRGRNPLGEVLRLGDYRFRVIGVLAPTGRSLGVDIDDMVLLPVANVQRMVNREGYFRVILEIRNVREMDAAKEEVKNVLMERHDGREDFTLVTQESVMSSLNDILSMLTAALAAIASISLLVAGVGIMNVMFISVAERTPEVGLMKAVGASRYQVLLLFLAEAATLALTGGIAGVLLGGLGIWFLGNLAPDFPFYIPIWAIEASLLVAVGVGLLFGLIPAAKASKLPPVESLEKGL